MKLGWSNVTRPQQVGLKRSKRKGNSHLAKEEIVSIKERTLSLGRSRKADPVIRIGCYQLIVAFLILTTTYRWYFLSSVQNSALARDTHSNTRESNQSDIPSGTLEDASTIFLRDDMAN